MAILQTVPPVVTEGQLNFSDVTTANASATAHGLVPKWPNNTTTFFRGDGTFAAPAGGSGALVWAGGNTTEATTTSTTAVDLITVASLSIAVGTPVYVMASARKTTGAANWIAIGLKLNTTVVIDGNIITDTTDVARSGHINARFIYGNSSYLKAGHISGGSDQDPETSLSFDTDMPTATLTDVILRGRCGNAAITMGIDDMQVYTHAVS